MKKKDQHIDIQLLTGYLANELSKEDEKQVEAWIEESHENKARYTALQEVWNSMDQTSLHQNIDIDAEWGRFQKAILPEASKKVHIFRLQPLLKIAAVFIIGIGIGFFGFRFLSVRTVKTQVAETRLVGLPDGSTVTLNSGSVLKYPRSFNRKDRTVVLEGEAYFEVEKNPELPFIIRFKQAEIKVLGTSFNVKAYKNMKDIEVTVNEGRVSLYDKGSHEKKVVATAGEKALFNKELKYVKKQANEDRNFISWKTRIMEFDDDLLPVVVETLKDVYHRDIVLTDQALNNCTITTTFENKDLKTVLKILESTLDIRVSEKEGKILISGKGC